MVRRSRGGRGRRPLRYYGRRPGGRERAGGGGMRMTVDLPELGAGKTHLVRAVAEGLGLRDARAVTSPTFVLIQEYPARLPVYHFDAYRLAGEAEFADLGAEEYLSGGGVCLVEWADRVSGCL